MAAFSVHGANAQQAIPCDGIAEPPLSYAVAEARRFLAERWLEVGQNLYIAYRMRSPTANPFDLTRPKQQEPNTKESEEGYIWVGHLQCQAATTRSDEVVVTFIAGAASFIEKKGNWTRPLRQRELTRIVVTRRDARWIAMERRGDYSILGEDDELRRPAGAEIPPRNKRLGIPCDANQTWKAERCTALPRAVSKTP